MHLHERRLGALVALAILGTLAVVVIDTQGLYGVNVNVDILAHTAGGVAVGAGTYVVLHRVLSLRRMYTDLLAIGAIVVAAVGVEIFEIYSPIHSGYIVLGAQDTQGDILGVVAGGLLALMVARYYRADQHAESEGDAEGDSHSHTH